VAEVFFGPEKFLLLWLRDYCLGRPPGRDELFELSAFSGRRLVPGTPLYALRPRLGLDYAALSYLVSPTKNGPPIQFGKFWQIRSGYGIRVESDQRRAKNVARYGR
jgi:hypothetical protein